MKVIDLKEALQVIKDMQRGQGNAVTIVFFKRISEKDLKKSGKVFIPEIRKMNCRIQQGKSRVKKHLRGGPQAYSFTEKQLIPTFDMVKGAYRSVPLEGIMNIRADGEFYKVRHKLSKVQMRVLRELAGLPVSVNRKKEERRRKAG